MATIRDSYGSGGSGLSASGSQISTRLAEALREVADDVNSLHTTMQTLLAKLDGDSGVGDTDYLSTLTTSVPKTQRG